ncbi:MAG: DinB family protein [Thermomicrobiales bacterium]
MVDGRGDRASGGCGRTGADAYCLIQEQDNPELTPYDPDALVIERGYQDQPLDPLVEKLLALRAERLGMLRALTPAQWVRTGVIPGRGATPLTAVTVHLCWHDTTHLAQIVNNLAAA